MKICRICEISKELSEFNKAPRNRDNLNNRCKGCTKEYNKNRRINNYDNVIASERNYDKNNRDNKLKYYNDNREKILKYAKEYRLEHKDRVNECINKSKRTRYHSDPTYRLKEVIRKSIRNSLVRNDYSKRSKTHDILGCSFDEFRTHIESQWEPWMSWDNYGNPKDGIIEPNKTWDIDHIIPTSSAITEGELLKLNHYTNLQPLCTYVNRFIKRDALP